VGTGTTRYTPSQPGQYAEQSLHGTNNSWTYQEPYHNPIGQNWCGNFHVFGSVWSPGDIKLTVDGVVTADVSPGTLPPGSAWPFDTYPESPVLDLQLGQEGGNVDPNSLPQTMYVDWIRIWH
jgi:Glycosyl hydrolases family 16